MGPDGFAIDVVKYLYVQISFVVFQLLFSSLNTFVLKNSLLFIRKTEKKKILIPNLY